MKKEIHRLIGFLLLVAAVAHAAPGVAVAIDGAPGPLAATLGGHGGGTDLDQDSDGAWHSS